MADEVKLVDPRTQYVQPPYDQQQLIDMPGHTGEMNPRPDHGEDSYRGAGLLKGLRAVVTGADSGIGRAVALAYAREGASVVISYLSEDTDADETRRLVEEAGSEALCVAGDLTSESTCKKLIGDAVKRFGGIDILVNNAAYQVTREEIDEFSTEEFDRILKTNVYAPFWLSRDALPKLTSGGSIINTVSIQGYDPSPELLPYAVTKSALLGMTKGLAKLAINRGVRVNAVAPGPVWTPLIPGSVEEEKVRQFGSNTLFGRAAQPAELAPLYVWLALPSASYVTGEVFGATGGRTPV